MESSNCIFCKIASGQSSAAIIYHDENLTAFHDIHPVAPVHILIIPNRHIESVNSVTAADEALLGSMISLASRLAAEHGVDKTGYRLVMNTGPHAGQSVFHLHLHLLGGRHLPFRFE